MSEVDEAVEDEGIRIEAPKEPEVKPEVYRDVVHLLTKGFLTSSVEINAVRFIFKSLNHHEFDLLRLIGGLDTTKDIGQHFWNLFLAYGVLMVDGRNVLIDRERWVPEIANTFKDFHQPAKQKIIRYLSSLNRRSSIATTLTEAYATESYSRYKWAQLKGLDMMIPSVTGIAGTEKLGMNYAQLTWRSINYYEDMREAQDRDWENAKFVGGCMAGKGIQKIHQSDLKRRQTYRETLLARKDAILRYALLGDPLDSDIEKIGNSTKLVARTFEDLAVQLEQDLRGEKDWHDEVVEAHEQRVREAYQDQQAKLRELQAEQEADFDGQKLRGHEKGAALTPAELQERLMRQKQYAAQMAASRVFIPQIDPKASEFHERWGLSGEPIVSPADREVHEVPPARPVGTPFRRK